ncbi:DNA-directed RNA polymerase II subunit RPB2 [Marasmius tenuissimus]|nr:DNA-directed RNA polymerase II subunit RPB2 [Marasmius tenuissimus]
MQITRGQMNVHGYLMHRDTASAFYYYWMGRLKRDVGRSVQAPIYNTWLSGGDSVGLEGSGESPVVVLRLGEVLRVRNHRNEPVPLSRPAEFATSGLPAYGLIKNLALMSYISAGSYSAPVIEFSKDWGLESLEENAHSSTPCNKVFVNGVWLGAGYSRESCGCTRALDGFTDRCSLSRINNFCFRRSIYADDG